MEEARQPGNLLESLDCNASGMAAVDTRSAKTIISLCVCCGVAVRGSAQARAASPHFSARGTVRGPVASTNTEDPSASGTSIDVRARSSALLGLEEVVAQAPGARVLNTGGYGAFSGVALRGAGIEHTTVLLGDLPLSTADSGPFDLSLIPLSLLQSVEVFRGGAPVWWSDGAIGGTVRLVPRSAERNVFGMQTGVGSFGHFELGVDSSALRSGGAQPSFFSHVDYAHSDNDYRYLDDGQTRFDTTNAPASADDRVLTQHNAAIDAANGLAHAGVDLAAGRLDVVLLSHARQQGIPGPLAAPTQGVRQRSVRMLGALSWTKEALTDLGERRYRVQAVASVNHQNDRFTDLDGELGISKRVASNDDWNRAYGRLAGGFALTPWLLPTLVASVARDDYRPEDPLAFDNPPRPSGRTSTALAFEPSLHGRLSSTHLELRPSVRAQWSDTSIWNSDNAAVSMRERRHDLLATYRVAAVVAPWPTVAFSASASSGARLPSLLELFGDRVYQQPNPTLKPEHSRAIEAGVVLRGTSGRLRGSAELRGHVQAIDDLIRYRRTSQYTVEPENIDQGRIVGAEIGTQAAYGRHLLLAASLDAMDTRNQFDKRLPLRPPLQFSLRPEVILFPGFADRTSIFVEAEHVAFVYLDDANRTFLPARTIFSVGGALRFLNERMTLSARARNIFDVWTQDVLSRPLPGFQLLVSLAVQEAMP